MEKGKQIKLSPLLCLHFPHSLHPFFLSARPEITEKISIDVFALSESDIAEIEFVLI